MTDKTDHIWALFEKQHLEAYTPQPLRETPDHQFSHQEQVPTVCAAQRALCRILSPSNKVGRAPEDPFQLKTGEHPTAQDSTTGSHSFVLKKARCGREAPSHARTPSNRSTRWDAQRSGGGASKEATPKRPPIAARAAALRWLATRRIPVPWGGRARLGRPRACEWCIWKCLVAVTLAAGRYAMGWKPESSAGPRVSLDFLLHPPGPVLPGSSGGRYASGGPWRGRGGFCQWMWTELASRSAARMSVTCLSMRFEPSTGHWESRPPGRRWGSGRGALSRCGGKSYLLGKGSGSQP